MLAVNFSWKKATHAFKCWTLVRALTQKDEEARFCVGGRLPLTGICDCWPQRPG